MRVISNPTLNPLRIFSYLFPVHGATGMAAVDNLEDVVGGHIWVGLMCIGGGIWHIISKRRKSFSLVWRGLFILQFRGDRLYGIFSCNFCFFQ